MSNTYQLTTEIHQLIDQINQKTGKELRVESDYYWYIRIKTYQYKDIVEKRYSEPAIINQLEVDELHREYNLCPTLNPDNIQRLLCELELGENNDYLENQNLEDKVYNQLITKSFIGFEQQAYKEWGRRIIITELTPQSQAKALSDKWFSLQETDGKATPSLWNSGEEGQIQVLTELKEVLENYLNN